VWNLRGPARCEPWSHMVATEVAHSREEETGHARARTGAGIHAMDPPLYGAAAIGQSGERGSTTIRL
jgi:hypothetical protein